MNTVIPHGFRSGSRTELVRALRQVCSDPQLCNTRGRSQREIAAELGLSESTWKRTRGVGGEWHKVDIYYLLKFIAMYSDCSGITLLTPRHPDYKAVSEPIVLTHDLELPQPQQQALSDKESSNQEAPVSTTKLEFQSSVLYCPE